MKILQIVPYFYPAWSYGGPGKLVYDIGKELSNNHNISILTSDAYDKTQRMPAKLRLKSKKNFSVSYFPNISNTLAYKYNIYISWKFFINSIKHVYKTDVVHIHDFYTLHNAWISVLCLVFRKPYIISIHGCLEERRVIEKKLLKSFFMKTFGNIILKNSTFNIASSLNEVQSYKNYNLKKEKICFLPNGVNTDKIKTKTKKEVFKKTNSIPLNKVIYTFLGRIHKIKGLDLLIDTLSKEAFEKCHFIIAGSDDGYLDELKKYIKEKKVEKKVTLMGAVFGTRKYDLFNASDVFIYPSYSEGFSIGILEAAGFGLPLIITKGCNFNQVSKKEAGIVIENSPLDFQKAINEMINKSTRNKFSRNAKKLISENYSIQSMTKKLSKIYSKAIKPHKIYPKKNIIWIHSHFLYWMGGTKFIYQVLNQIKKNQPDVNVVVIVENSSTYSEEKFKNLKVDFISLNNLTSTNYIYWLLFPLFILIDILKIKRFLKRHHLNNKNSIIISSMFPMNVVSFFLKIKHFQNCYEPFAFFHDNSFISQFHFMKVFLIKILSYIYSPLDIWATKKSKKVFTLNNITQELIKKVYKVDSIKTLAGVDFSLFKKYTSLKIKNKYHGKKIAIHSTDYSPVKGTDLVIKAFSKASKKIDNALLLITTTIENQTKQNELQHLAEKLGVGNKIKFLGFLPIKELPQYYSLANVMIQGAFSKKSGTTSMSLPVKEAMCCETPAIRPDMGGEDVVDNETGFLVDPQNTDLLAEKIQILLKSNKLSKDMGRKARLFIKNKYSWKNTAEIFYNQID